MMANPMDTYQAASVKTAADLKTIADAGATAFPV
jgi:hypothetical protein